MLTPWRRDDGVWVIPKRAEDTATGTVGHGWAELTPSDPMYQEWTDWIRDNMPEAWEVATSEAIEG